MCNERERLIGYIYDDCDAAERAQIARHLDECEACRHEIGALRDVRQDLLAWEVPEHSPVWRAFAPPRVRATWRDIPVWALAAAASLMLIAGAGGGVLTHVMWPHEPATVVTQAPVVSTVPAAFTSTDFDARERDLEQRLIAMLRAELSRTRVASPAPVSPVLVSTRAADLDSLIQWRAQQERLNDAVVSDVSKLISRTTNLERTTSQMQMMQAGGVGTSPNR